MIYADRAFESCETELNEQCIHLVCCDTHAHVQFIERGIRFVKERIQCIRSMLPSKIKRIPSRPMRELITSTIKMINSIRREGGEHPVMSPRQIVTGRKLILPPYPPGMMVYAVKGDSSNSIDEIRTFDTLYLRPDADGGGHFVYNIDTMQRNLACRVIGVNKKPIPMTDLMIKVINS